jgi:transposase
VTIATIDAEIVDAEVVEPQPLSASKAKALDKKIRSASDKIAQNFNTLTALLEEAYIGQIHVALELPSWTAYVKEAVDIQVSDRYERKEYAKLMSGKGMSQRIIADVLGVSQKTIDRDLEGEEFDTDTITTADGKTSPRNKKPKDVEVEEEPAEIAHQTSVAEDFRNEVYQLQNDVEAFKEVLEDERFPKARARLAKSKAVEDFRAAIDELEDLLVIIVGEEDTAPEDDE